MPSREPLSSEAGRLHSIERTHDGGSLIETLARCAKAQHANPIAKMANARRRKRLLTWGRHEQITWAENVTGDAVLQCAARIKAQMRVERDGCCDKLRRDARDST